MKGSITAGKLADFVMLEKDPHDVNPDEIKDIKIVRTVVGGKTMYPKGELVKAIAKYPAAWIPGRRPGTAGAARRAGAEAGA